MEQIEADVCVVGAGYAGLHRRPAAAAGRAGRGRARGARPHRRPRVDAARATAAPRSTWAAPSSARTRTALALAEEMGVDALPHQRAPATRSSPPAARCGATRRTRRRASTRWRWPASGRRCSASTAMAKTVPVDAPWDAPKARSGTPRRRPRGCPGATCPPGRARHARGDAAGRSSARDLVRGVAAQRAVPHPVGRRAAPVHVDRGRLPALPGRRRAPRRSRSGSPTSSATRVAPRGAGATVRQHDDRRRGGRTERATVNARRRRDGHPAGARRPRPLRPGAARPTRRCCSTRCRPAPRSRRWPCTTSRSGGATACAVRRWPPTTPFEVTLDTSPPRATSA